MSGMQCRTVKEIMDRIEGITLNEKHGGRFHFRMYLTGEMMQADLSELDLSPRSSNCLKRAGYDTVGKLVERVSGSEDLKNIRNCGAKSIREIMEHLFLFQYYSLKPEAREKYLMEVVAMNTGQYHFDYT